MGRQNPLDTENHHNTYFLGVRRAGQQRAHVGGLDIVGSLGLQGQLPLTVLLVGGAAHHQVLPSLS